MSERTSTDVGEGAEAPSEPVRFGDVPAPAREVMALFVGPLRGVRFPDVDVEILEGLAQDVAARAAAVADAHEALQRARAALEESQRVILAATDKGLSYARVYTGGVGPLGERVDALLAARAAAKPARRGRRRKRGVASEPARSKAGQGVPMGKELPLAGVA